ncbi:MAG: prephenate dehydratase [Bacteroidetes bacterium]|nr:MAG: prephenate dehydratase [Bacteroidota bacterium]
MKVAIQGSPASFHETAAHRYFGKRIELVYCKSFRESCGMLAGNQVDYAVMAIENTIAGAILPNYGLLHELGLHIFGETQIPVRLSLLALPGSSLHEIEFVLSHPVALRQCTRYLAGLPHLVLQEGPDTASCARTVAGKKLAFTAAIATAEAAPQYGLDILATRIEDHAENFTRFWILSKGRNPAPDADKASACFLLPHRGGSLADLLSELAATGVNIQRIQSLPVAGDASQYRFFIDFSWSESGCYENALAALYRHSAQMRVLGKYKSGEILKTTKT